MLAAFAVHFKDGWTSDLPRSERCISLHVNAYRKMLEDLPLVASTVLSIDQMLTRGIKKTVYDAEV